MSLKTSAIIVLIALAASCSVPDDNSTGLTVLDLSQDLTVKSEMTLSQIADKITYTKLESNPGCFIERIHQYSISKKHILIFDRKQNQILLFDRKGKFLRKISRSGKGPGEFTYPRDVRISRNEKYILINQMQTVLQFGFDGKFLGDIPIPGHASIIDTFNDGLVGFFTSHSSVAMDNYTIILFDWGGNITAQLGKRNWDRLKNNPAVRRSMFYYMNSELRINEGFYDTVYAVTDNNEFEPRISIIHNYDFDLFKRESNPMEIRDFQLDVWMETPDYLFVNGPYQNMMHPMSLDKESGKIYHIPFDRNLKTYGIPNDLDGGTPFWPSRYKDGKVYSIKYSYQLKSVLDNELFDTAEYKDQGLRNQLLAFKETLSDEDGPIIIEIELK